MTDKKPEEKIEWEIRVPGADQYSYLHPKVTCSIDRAIEIYEETFQKWRFAQKETPKVIKRFESKEPKLEKDN